MVIPNSFWEVENEGRTVASFLVRGFCQAEKFDNELKSEELYYILDTLGIKKRFSDYWDHPEFYQRAGMVHLAVNKIDKSKDGWRTQQGDFAWAAGKMDEALRFYEQSILHPDSTHSGYAGKFRISFVKKEFKECIDIFRKICPPHSFYIEYRPLFGRSGEEGFDFNKATEAVSNKYKKNSPYFISNAKYMLQTVVYAATNTGLVDNELQEMISDYFETTREEIDKLAVSLHHNEKEYARLVKRIKPKAQKTGNTIDFLIRDGSTEKAKSLCQKLLSYEKIIAETEASIIHFLKNGDETILDKIINFNPPFGISGADRIIYGAALESISKRGELKPELQLILLRRFNHICGYPEGRNVWRSDKWCYEGGFWEVYRNSIFSTDDTIQAADILMCLRNLWRLEGAGDIYFNISFIDKHYDWCEIMLVDYVNSMDKNFLTAEGNEIRHILLRAYNYLRERYKEARNNQIWVSEELLAKAIKRLFGKENVTQHASPIWLSPQHLDIYLPRYNLAIEYMGKQHYEPVDIFGGEKAFTENQKRDKRKAELCSRMNVNLFYVTYEEDIGKCAKQIFELYGK